MIPATDAAAFSVLTVIRTSSEPARASSAICVAVALMFSVSVLVMDCTTTGCSDPTKTPPTLTVGDGRLACTSVSEIMMRQP